MIFDIANIEYTSEETITITTNDRFNNDTSIDTFIVEGFMYNANITLSQRTRGVNVTGYTVPSMIHKVGNEPVTTTNPLPVETVDANGNNTNSQYIVSQSYGSNGLIEFVGRTLPNTGKGEAKWQIKKLTYDGRKITDIQYAGGTNAFNQIWNNRASLSYS